MNQTKQTINIVEKMTSLSIRFEIVLRIAAFIFLAEKCF